MNFYIKWVAGSALAYNFLKFHKCLSCKKIFYLITYFSSSYKYIEKIVKKKNPYYKVLNKVYKLDDVWEINLN